jgi:hypothetical protein
MGLDYVNLYIVFFRSLIDFNWIEGHLISNRIGLDSDRIGLDSDRIGSDRINLTF